MTCEYVFRDVTDIYTRLFNHRAALHGLSNNFVKEFEEKQGEGEQQSLSHTLEMVAGCRDRMFPTVSENLQSHLEQLKLSVEKAKELCDRIQQDADEKKTDWIESNRLRRDHEWREFMSAQVARSGRVDAEFENRVKSLQKHYSDLEERLGETRRVL